MCNDNIKTGLNGYNSYTKLTATFVMPDEGETVSISVNNIRPLTGEWATLGQKINILGSTFEVTVEGTSTLTIKNIANASTGAYSDNADAGTVFPIGSKVSPSGQQGVKGETGVSGNTSGVLYYKATNSVQSTTYTQLDLVNVTRLVNDGDSVEIESVLRYTNSGTTTFSGYKFEIDGVLRDEYTSANLVDASDIRYIVHRVKLTRLSNVLVSYHSSFFATDSSGIINNINNEQTFSFSSPAVTSAADLDFGFFAKNNNTSLPVGQVVLQIKYIPFI